MLCERDLPLRIVGQEAFIDFLGPQDEPWLRVLVAEMLRFEGRRWREMAERLCEPLRCEAPLFKRRSATRVLGRIWHRDRVSPAPPIDVRVWVFRTAAAKAAPREDILGEAALHFGVTPDAVAESLFADLPGERRVRAPNPVPGTSEIALRTNLAIAQATLMRASHLDIRVRGAVRGIVGLAKLHGLLCVVRQDDPDAEPVLEISGPFSLFRHTLIYGRALAALLPQLAWCARFDLRAQTALRGRIVDVRLQSGAPLFVPDPPRAFDSKLEERFARDFERAAPDWHLIREPEPLRAGNTLIFPDFLLQHRIHTRRRVLVEIVGFWTPDYLANKMARLRQTGLTDLILCVDDDRACTDADLPERWPIVRFRRRVDALAVLRIAETLTASH